MLLITCGLPSGDKRVSDRALALEHPWQPHVAAMDPVQFGCRERYGGYADFQWGGVAFVPEMFDDDWYPPASVALTAAWTATDEAAAVTLFSGTAHRERVDETEVRYGLHGPAGHDTQVASGTAFSDTLVNVFTWACNAARLNLTLNTTLARSPSPAIVHTTGADLLLIDLLSGMAAWHTHFFYIDGSTLYLVDMAADNGSVTLTDFDFFPNAYDDEAPVSRVHDTGDVAAVFTDYPYGDPVSVDAYQTNAVAVAAALALIKDILVKPVVTLRMPVASGGLPTLGKKYTFTDRTRLRHSTDVVMRARTLDWDLTFGASGRVSVVGEAEVAATP